MHHYKLILLYIIIGLLTRGWCLTKPEVEIGHEGSTRNFTYKYITLGKLDSNDEPYSLDCVFDLDEGEELESIVWYYAKVDEVGSSIFSWKPNEEPQVSGILVDQVTMTRNDGMIKFLERHREYEGFYFCEVKTNAKSAMSESFQLVMADFGSRSYYSSLSVPAKNCVVKYSLKTPALYPPPQVEHGVWDGKNWIEKVQLVPITYSNGSRQYTLQDHEYHVDKYPEGSTIYLTVGFIIQEEYVPVSSMEARIPHCTVADTVDGNTDVDDGGDSGSDNSNDGGDNGGNNAATSWPVSLAASTAVVLCLLYVHY